MTIIKVHSDLSFTKLLLDLIIFVMFRVSFVSFLIHISHFMNFQTRCSDVINT